MSLNAYYTLGRSGLRVSRLALGTMTFGTEWGWGADETTARALFDRYLAAGGNFIDTADAYTNGFSMNSPDWVRKWASASWAGARSRAVCYPASIARAAIR